MPNSFCEEAVKEIPELKKENLIEKIDNSLKHGNNHPEDIQEFMNATLLKVKKHIEENDHYRYEIAQSIAWDVLTSTDFFESIKEWYRHEAYFDALIAYWYREACSGNILNFYRLIAQRYYAQLKKTNSDPFNKKRIKIKKNSDLCDAELIHYAGLGEDGKPVIVITFDSEETIKRRVSIHKEGLRGLVNQVSKWQIHPLPGKILCISKEKSTKLKPLEIISGTIVDF